MLPQELKSEVLRKARRRGVSLGQLIRESLQENLARPAVPAREDSLLSDNTVFSGRVPKHFAERHDDFLYGKDE